ncbi:hypothetical protein [Bradyrhizobium liaoningense]|uniref:hypothetical protein n=1 Tax=Bradyrhizobium liaoningense TaxID=43992 RepID=UPI001BA6F573|nr:hypothetical protein [Bradyrhizobium liaoningense]MBR0855503.1 hypothetical protein [Bradyrhizobium liaoningense]
MPATELDAKTAKKRDELCAEALKLRKKHKPAFDRLEAIKAELKLIANELGRGFRQTDPKIGHVSVSPEKPERFDGDFPVIDVRKLQALPDAQRQKLYDDGIVATESKWSKPYYGQVTIELY